MATYKNLAAVASAIGSITDGSVAAHGRYNATNFYGAMTSISGNGEKFLNTSTGLFDQTSATAYIMKGGQSLDCQITISGGGNQKAVFSLLTAGEGNHEMRFWFGASL